MIDGFISAVSQMNKSFANQSRVPNDDNGAKEEIKEKVSDNANGLKRISINENCSACGICYGSSEHFAALTDGKATNKYKVLPQKAIAEVDSVIEMCPSDAISLISSEYASENVSQFLKKAKKAYKRVIKKTLPKVKFDDSNYKIKCPDFNLRSDPRGVSKDYDRTDRDGFMYFKYSVFPYTKQIVQNMLIDYKTSTLSAFYNIKKDPNNFYKKVNEKLRLELANIAMAAKELFDIEIDIKKFQELSIQPQKEVSGINDLYSLYSYRIENLEEIYIADTIANELNVDYYEYSVEIDDSPYDNDKYIWCISKLLIEWYKDIRKEITRYMNSSDSPIHEIINDMKVPYEEQVKSLWEDKMIVLSDLLLPEGT